MIIFERIETAIKQFESQ